MISAMPALALPPADDIPEEILRTAIITEARSPLTGEPLSAEDYAALVEDLRDPNIPRRVSSDLTQLIYLLQLRRLGRRILPMIIQ
ncbi:MAG: glutathione S-transferase [Leptolyngbya sp. LCM1.Bin17]|nr:MAG: glutathione S-transferase [Leptolyngbya sp. LCM1.Bin17]